MDSAPTGVVKRSTSSGDEGSSTGRWAAQHLAMLSREIPSSSALLVEASVSQKEVFQGARVLTKIEPSSCAAEALPRRRASGASVSAHFLASPACALRSASEESAARRPTRGGTDVSSTTAASPYAPPEGAEEGSFSRESCGGQETNAPPPPNEALLLPPTEKTASRKKTAKRAKAAAAGSRERLLKSADGEATETELPASSLCWFAMPPTPGDPGASPNPQEEPGFHLGGVHTPQRRKGGKQRRSQGGLGNRMAPLALKTADAADNGAVAAGAPFLWGVESEALETAEAVGAAGVGGGLSSGVVGAEGGAEGAVQSKLQNPSCVALSSFTAARDPSFPLVAASARAEEEGGAALESGGETKEFLETLPSGPTTPSESAALASELPKRKGVRFQPQRNRFVAEWYQDGKTQMKYFPVRQYGFKRAWEEAKLHRLRAVEEKNQRIASERAALEPLAKRLARTRVVGNLDLDDGRLLLPAGDRTLLPEPSASAEQQSALLQSRLLASASSPNGGAAVGWLPPPRVLEGRSEAALSAPLAAAARFCCSLAPAPQLQQRLAQQQQEQPQWPPTPTPPPAASPTPVSLSSAGILGGSRRGGVEGLAQRVPSVTAPLSAAANNPPVATNTILPITTPTSSSAAVGVGGGGGGVVVARGGVVGGSSGVDLLPRTRNTTADGAAAAAAGGSADEVLALCKLKEAIKIILGNLQASCVPSLVANSERQMEGTQSILCLWLERLKPAVECARGWRQLWPFVRALAPSLSSGSLPSMLTHVEQLQMIKGVTELEELTLQRQVLRGGRLPS